MKEEKNLELTDDYIFKRIFGKKGNEDILIDLLESILEIKIEKIEVVPEAELEKVNKKDKLGAIDLKSTVNNNITIDIEMQVKNHHNIVKRSLFYVTGLYHTGLKSGEKYEENNKVIGINILNFNIFKWKEYHSVGKIMEEKLKEIMTNEVELHFIELPKFLKTTTGENKKLRQWLEFICNKRKEEVAMAVKENEKIAKAKQEYEYLTGDAAVQRIAFLKDKWERDHNSDLAWERKEGEKKGRKEGEKETTEKIAIEMIKKNMPDETILEITQLTKAKLEELKEKIKQK